MSVTRPRSSAVLVVAAAAFAAWAPASAQTACITPNCVLGGLPAACANRAAPRTPTVFMRFSGIYYYYDPPDPKIEPGECIGWQASSQTHSSTGSGCSADPLCGSPAPAACQWDTANVVGGSATPTSTCFYDPSLYPAATADDFHCRVHTAMLGTIQVTPPIQLSVAKDLATSSVMLTWSGGGVIDDVSYKVERQSGGDPRFPVASTVTADPDAGSLDTTFTDAGDLTDPTTRYYLVRNKQSNEP